LSGKNARSSRAIRSCKVERDEVDEPVRIPNDGGRSSRQRSAAEARLAMIIGRGRSFGFVGSLVIAAATATAVRRVTPWLGRLSLSECVHLSTAHPTHRWTCQHDQAKQ